MEKVIVKTALLTIAGLAVAAVIVFFTWLLCSPQTMADSCEKMGNYSLAVTCADLRYKYTGEVNDLARCAEDSILSEDNKHIVTYCKKLVEHADFDRLCDEKNQAFANIKYGEHTGDYKDFVCGHLALAQYRSGNIKDAVAAADISSVQSFVKMIVEIYDNKDKPAAQEVIPALEGRLSGLEDKKEIELTKNLIEILKKL